MHPIANFARSPPVSIAARARATKAAYLKKLGVRTVVDLEIGDWIEAAARRHRARKQVARSSGSRSSADRCPAFQPFVSDAP